MGGFNVDPDRYREMKQSADKDRMIAELESELKGPDGFATWKDAAVHERVLRVAADKCIKNLEKEIDTLKAGRYLYTLYENNRKFFTSVISEELIDPIVLAREFNDRIQEPPYHGYIVAGVYKLSGDCQIKEK